MSWYKKFAGKALDVAPEIGKWAANEREQSYHNEPAKEAIGRSEKLATELLSAYPERAGIVELQGHLDLAGGSVKVDIQILS